MKKRTPIILLHDIEPKTENQWTISIEHFRSLLTYLKSHKYQTVTCEEIALQKGYQSNQVAITFDDGHQGFYEYALPLLSEFNYTATVFMTTEYIDKNDSIFRGLSADQLKMMAKLGMEIGSHSKTHQDLTELKEIKMIEQIRESKNKLEKIIDKPVRVFSYPHGQYDMSVMSTVKAEGYAGAFSVFTGVKNTSFDQFAYDRLEISNHHHPLCNLEFKLKTSGYYLL